MRVSVLVLGSVLGAVRLLAGEPPTAEAGNGLVQARFYLPDAAAGYYRGTRFDWSGVIPSLKTGRHEYFGQWFPKYDPKLHDAIAGPVEEFTSLGYEKSAPGGRFVRIGVGVVKRPEGEEKYRPFATYEIVDGGEWQVTAKADQVKFRHRLRDGSGYAYEYTKTVRFPKGKAEMIIEHALKNVGSERIAVQQYNHNFFMMDGQPTGPDSLVEVGFPLEATRPFANAFARAEGREIRYAQTLETGESTYAEFRGGAPYEVRMENRKAKAGVRIHGDRPVAKLVYWSIRTTFCPEAYIDVVAEPGRTAKWSYRYEFYDLP